MNTPLPFRPHPLLRNGHLQTIMAGVSCGPRPPYQATPLVIPTHDGESLVIHEELGPPTGNDAHLVILVHGLGGDHSSPYLQRLAFQLRAAGFLVWRVDLRGCGHGIDHAWKPANAGRSDDLATVLQAAMSRHPGRPVHFVGFSLSGNILLKMLGEICAGSSPVEVDHSQLASSLAVAPPANLKDCADNMDRLSRRPYCKYYLKLLDQQVQQKRNRWARWQKLPAKPKLRTIRQFDAFYTAPLSGFRSAEDYYLKSSSIDLLQHIKVPTQILIDLHDPIVTAKSLELAQFSASTEVVRTRFGGHMGYFGVDEQGHQIRWLEYYVVEYLKRQRSSG
ncbi:MAG: alpha/beta fold hydrolase [bacterium]|nr:alpha/beta fold hydrolase [bacterium]